MGSGRKGAGSGPRWIGALASLLLPRDRREVVLGDILELYELRSREAGRAAAMLRALFDVLGSAWSIRRGRPGAGRRALRGGLGLDLRLAFRGVVREPAFTLVMVLTLGIGTGAVASVFGMLNQLMLRPLPGVGDTEGVGYLRLTDREQPDPWNGTGLTMTDFEALLEGADFATALSSYGNLTLHVARREGRPIGVWGNAFYGNFFEVLDARAEEGRLLTWEDVRRGSDPRVAVISTRLRQQLFGPEEGAAGATVTLNGVPVRIVGVVGGGFQGPERRSGADVWVPHGALVPLLDFPEDRLSSRQSAMHGDLIVRLAPGTTPEQATERVESLVAGFAEAHPGDEYLQGLRATFFAGLSAPPGPRASIRQSLSLLGLVVLLVCVLACANAANLQLHRNVSRRGQMAVRRALGASAGRIMRGELATSLVLAVLGTAAGIGIAVPISLFLRGESLVGLPEIEPLVLDGRVLVFAALVSVGTGLLFGGLPAALAGRFDLRGALQAAGRGGTNRGVTLRGALASAQIGLALTLFVTGTLLVRTVANLYAVDPGVDVDRVVVLHLEFPRQLPPEVRDRMSEEMSEAVEALANVERAALGHYDPLGTARSIGRIERDGMAEMRAEVIPVSAEWFDAMGVDAADGRPLRIDPAGWATDAVILTHGLAERLFGSAEAAVGRPVRHRFGPDATEARVVAVTGPMRTPHEPDEPREGYFVPLDKRPVPMVTLLARTTRLDEASLEEIREAVEGVLTDVPVADPRPLRSYLDRVHAEQRVFGMLLALLSVSSVLLAAVGLYGVVSASVTSRRREVGVRVAIGAGAGRIVGLVSRWAGAIVGAGVIAGLFGGYALASIAESRLYGVGAADPAAYLFSALLFVVVSALACAMPVRRALAVDPVVELRSE